MGLSYLIDTFNPSRIYSIDDLQLFFKKGEITPSLYLQLIIERTNKHNKDLNAYISYNKDLISYESQFKISDQPMLKGIPFNIKDCFLTKEFPTSYGVKEEYVTSSGDSSIVQLFEKNGAILIGKTSLPAFAYDVQTFNDIIGVTPNPWNEEYSAGGSTGGGAVSVATGLIPLAIGSDFAGSIRIPASFCGVKGYIPTNAKKLLRGHYPDPLNEVNQRFFLGQAGFLSNFLSDFKKINTMVSDRQIESEKFNPETFSIIITKQDQYIPVALDIQEILNQIASILKIQKLDVSDTHPKEFSFKEIGQVHAELMNATFTKKDNHKNSIPTGLSQKKKLFMEELDEFLENKIWVLPVTATTVIKHNYDHKPIKIDGQSIPYWRAMIHYTRPFNIVDNPIITLPVGFSSNGLPIGVQLITSKGNDQGLIKFGEFLENKLGKIGNPPGFDVI